MGFVEAYGGHRVDPQVLYVDLTAGYSSLVAWGLHIFNAMAARLRDSFGLLLASPLDLLEELVACGAFHCMLEPRYAYWPMPDQMRFGHLIRALPDFNDEAWAVVVGVPDDNRDDNRDDNDDDQRRMTQPSEFISPR